MTPMTRPTAALGLATNIVTTQQAEIGQMKQMVGG